MHPTATIANVLWSASNLPAYARLVRALHQPQAAQARILRKLLRRNADSAFGQAHGFARIRDHLEFSQRVPLADYGSHAPWIDRIRQGEPNVLTREPVSRLVPTSGSSGARKLIPFTAGLQREFDAAIGPWLVDLSRQVPGLLGGPAYWSITPLAGRELKEDSAVPIGFDEDTAYLGGLRQRLANAVMAVPPSVQHAESIDSFRADTLRHLLGCRDLRLISVWHPSFLTLLLDALPACWDRLLDEIQNGRGGLTKPQPQRAMELRSANPREPASLWPELRLISCWGDGAAELVADRLHALFPETRIQRKGLLATEAVVTIPFAQQYPLAVNSHFFEFIDGAEQLHLAHDLRAGEEYEVIVTTGGGLWRYRLRDRVLVTGFLGQTPALRFLGRAGDVSDRFGEKLSEEFVAHVIARVCAAGATPPRFTLLAPDEDATGCRYTLFLEGEPASQMPLLLDSLLAENPHYDWCRRLGQLQAPRLFRIQGGGYETFVKRACAGGTRLGDVKPRSLSLQTGWSEWFSGELMPATQPSVTPGKKRLT